MIQAATRSAGLQKPGQQFGRFRLVALMGCGAQATVWRAHDERLDREVALKLLGGDGTSAPAALWLNEARAVSRLAHPNIVPVFEADEIDGQPCMVFELVNGPTLAEVLRRSGAMPAREAVELMLGVVDALRAAHAQGIVHRDLKPSNILLDAEGRARVMDFGIAARLDAVAAGVVDALAGCIVGTPGYLSPEAAAGGAPSPQMDVFAAGLVLGELLSGAPLLAEREPLVALRRVQQEDLVLPEHADADDRLRAVVQRAIARDPAGRYDGAASLRDALLQWLAPADEAPLEGGSHGTLDFLLRRMRHKSDFPALTEHVLRIQRMANSDSENLNHLADEILKDVALTQKLLRLVNTTPYRRNGSGVSTVSRAVAMVGLGGIRNLALSLVLVEHMKDKAHAQRLKEEFLRSLLAGQLAHALSDSARDAEEAFLGAMFYNLGKLLTEYYFPEEAQAIRAQMHLSAPLAGARQAVSGAALLHPDLLADRAAAVVLGLGFEAFGVGVARHWGLPDTLQRCMHRPESASPAKPVPAGPERLRWLAVAASRGVADVLAAGIQDITDTLAGDNFRLNEVLRMVLETMYRALGFQRMVFCLRDASTGGLNGRFGLGDRAAALSPVFQVLLRWPAGQAPDLFGAVCLKGSDTLIADSRQSAIAQRLPAWYRQQVNAPSFLLLPMVMKGAPFALIYADMAKPGGWVLGDRELALLRTLRNQPVMAFRHASQPGA